MKNAFYGIALVSSLVLTACGGGGPAEPKIPGTGSGSTKLVSPVFVLSEQGSDIPVPNDLLFSETQDLTLNIPVADPTDFSDPQVAINALDGWSSHAPFSIKFDGGIDGASVVPGQTVRIFKTSVFRPEAIPGTGIPAPTGPVTGIEAELTAGVDFVTQVTGASSVAVIPLRPFEAQANYTVVLTNGISDTSGNALTASPHFAIAKSNDPIPAGSATSALEPVRALIDPIMDVLEASGSVASRDDVILAYQFTIQSMADALVTAKGVYIDLPIGLSGGTVFPATSFSSLFTDTVPFTGIGAADLYKGQVTLPYLLTPSTATNPAGVLTGRWVTAANLSDGMGGTFPNPLGGGGNLTYAIPQPEKMADEQVPLLVSLPKNPACPKPYPVMIFQHGITSDRTAMLGIADTMAGACTAVISMDQPLHGIAADNAVHQGLQLASGGLIGIFEGYAEGALHERTFGVDLQNNATGAVPSPDGIPDASGAHTINLGNLLGFRDNLRQATLDLLTLEKAIPAMDVDGNGIPDFDPTKVSFMGHSLGGIVGSTYTALSDMAKQSVLATTSGSIAQMLNGSQSFGPVIRGGLAAAAGIPETDPAFAGTVLAPFLFAAQTVVDSGDPINYGNFALAGQIPTLGLQIKNDSVVPNAVATGPLAGSIPHAAVFGLPAVTDTAMQSRGFLKFVSGNHATPLSPAGAGGPTEFLAETTAIQTAIATFIATGGTTIMVSDPALVEP